LCSFKLGDVIEL